MNNSKLTTAISDWINGDGGSFQAAETKRFLKMVNVSRTVGDDYKPPGRGLIANELLDINFERTMTTNKEKLMGQKKFGYTGMGDGATVGGMPLANEMWMAGDCPLFHSGFMIALNTWLQGARRMLSSLPISLFQCLRS